MNVAEVIAQLAEQVRSQGGGDVLCLDGANGSEMFDIVGVAWDDELGAHVIEIQPYE